MSSQLLPFNGVVAALSTTPVKGLRLKAAAELELTPAGVLDNRLFYLVDAKGRLFNGKRSAELTTVLADYDRATETLRLIFADGSTVADDVADGPRVETAFFSQRRVARAVSTLLSEALSAAAGVPLSLVRTDPGLTAVDRGTRGTVSLISSASVEYLAALAGQEVDPGRFRMLVEVTAEEPHAEDALVGRAARVGEALVEFHGHVGRCLVTTRHPVTGVFDLPTLDLLAYRKGLDTTEPLAFGIYGEVLEPGVVRLGDRVETA